MANQNLAHPELTAFEVHGMTRGSFILRGALASGAVYGAAAVAPFVSQALAQTGRGDVDILNFALTLEYLEADFYNVKGKAVGLSGQAKAYAQQFGADESEHVAAIISTIKKLGGTPAKKPAFAFPATSQASFLKLASVLENTGVSAYNGAAPMLQSKDVLAAAGGIVQIEARHAAAMNVLVGKSPTPDGGFDKTMTKQQVLAAAGPFIKM
jgi:hypothetical protein